MTPSLAGRGQRWYRPGYSAFRVLMDKEDPICRSQEPFVGSQPLLHLGLLSLPPPQLLVHDSLLSYLVCSWATRSVLVRPEVLRAFV